MPKSPPMTTRYCSRPAGNGIGKLMCDTPDARAVDSPPLIVKGVPINLSFTPTPAAKTFSGTSTGSHMHDVELGDSGYKPVHASQGSECLVPLALDFSADSPPSRIHPDDTQTWGDNPSPYQEIVLEDDGMFMTSKKRKAVSPSSPDTTGSLVLKKVKPMTKANVETDSSSASDTKEYLRQNVLDYFQKTQLKHASNKGSIVEGVNSHPSSI